MNTLISEYQKMKLRVETYEQAQKDLESTIRCVHIKTIEDHSTPPSSCLRCSPIYFTHSSSRQRIHTLEAELRTAQRKSQPLKENVVQMLSVQASERDMLSKSNTALRNENAELQFQLEDLRAELDTMRAQTSGSGSKGLLFPEALSTDL